MIVDSYAHVSLKKYQPVECLLEQMELASVEHAVLVQPLGDYDNNYLRTIVERYPKKFTAVGLVQVTSINVQRQLEQLIQNNRFAGVRATAEILKSKEVLATLAAVNGILVLHLPDGIGQHLEELIAVAEGFADLRIFIPHLGWPRNNGQPTPIWNHAIISLSPYPNVAIGISALHHFSERAFPHEDTWNLIETVVENIGAQRCMCGSNFPLLLESESYYQFFSYLSRNGPQFLRDFVTGGAAARFWGINL